MKPIREPKAVEYYGRLASEMMRAEEGEECEFNPVWVRSRNWKVVPVESMARIPPPDIARIVSVLNGAGHRECIAIFNEPGYIQRLAVTVASEPPSDMATCYLLAVEEADFRTFNRELGPFRSVLTTEDRSWSISCNEWYNLFAGKSEFLEALLGKPIEQARREFQEFASLLAKDKADDLLLQVARRYAAL